MSLVSSKNMDSVFDQCTEDELDFDVLFDEDDELIDSVEGLKENGEPLTGVDFEELHNTDDEAEPDDLRDALGPDNDNLFGTKKSDIEGAEEYDIPDNDDNEKDGKSDIDKFLDGENREDDYAEGKADGTVHDDIDTVTGYIKKDPDIATESDDFSLDAAIDPNGAPSCDGSDKEEPVSGEMPSDDGDGKVEDADDASVKDTEPEGEEGYQATDDASVKESADIDSILDENDDIDDDTEDYDGDDVQGDDIVTDCGNGGIPAGVEVKEGTDVDDELDDATAAEAEEEPTGTMDLEYDSSDEDLIDMVLGKEDE